MTEIDEADSADTNQARLIELAKHEDAMVRAKAIANANFPTTLLDDYLKDDSWYVRAFGVAAHPQISVELLLQLATDQSEEVRGICAKSMHMPAETLARLAGDESFYVRSYVASNIATPPMNLSDLAADSESMVRRSVAANPATPAKVLALLASDADVGVRADVASNQSTPGSTLEQLSQNKEVLVQESVRSNPTFQPDVKNNSIVAATPEDLKRLLDSGAIDCFAAAATSKAMAEESDLILTKLLWLQASLGDVDAWPNPGFDGFHLDYLDLMWDAFRIAATLTSEQEADETLLELMEAPDIWENPITPTAIALTSTVSANAVNSVLSKFISVSHDLNLERASPLIASLCLRPESDEVLVATTARIASEGNPRSPHSCAIFWEFVAGYVSRGETNQDWWCPFPWWRDGYFDEQEISNAPQIGHVQVQTLNALLIERASQDWGWENPYGDLTTRGMAITTLESWLNL